MPKPNISIKSLKSSKTKIPNEMAPDEVTTMLENLRVEMIALKSFAGDQVYIMQKNSEYWETSTHCDDSKILIKSLHELLKSKIKSKNAIIAMILDDHENEMGQPRPFGNRRENKTGSTMITTNTSFGPLGSCQPEKSRRQQRFFFTESLWYFAR